ncbi:MAG: SAM-dependent methyltransferase [Treponema sp.]|nr:SAM-dependent methyltransferase [Treponema sp.]
MILSVTLSKANSNVENELGNSYEKIKIKYENSAKGSSYFMEMFTKTQVFHKHLNEEELKEFLEKCEGKLFKNCVERREDEEITILANKKGKITRLSRKIESKAASNKNNIQTFTSNPGKSPSIKGTDPSNLDFLKSQHLNVLPQAKKNYILQEGNPIAFLVLLGIMNSQGKVIASRYDKFRQINRFLEFIDDILPIVIKDKAPGDFIRIADFGCGKSYLTFAVHYFLTQIKKLPCKIEGLDLKEEVINYCNQITEKLGLENLIFHTGNIADYQGKENPDIIITLHACDTATDFALKYAVSRQTKVILSVPCCQHQVNQQLKKAKDLPQEFQPLLKWGIIQEKFASLLTDACRGQWLENQGYKVQMLEFIDESQTPKNILIRAIKNTQKDNSKAQKPELIEKLKIQPEIWK